MHTGSFIRKGMHTSGGSGEDVPYPENGSDRDCLDSRAPREYRLRKFYMPGLAVILVIVIWLNEFLDLPSLFFGVPKTPVNWLESALESFFVLLAALAVWTFTINMDRHRARDKKRTERALKVSDERYRAFVQNLQGITYQLDMDLKPAFLHGEVERITGYREEDFLAGSMRWEDIIFAEDLPAIREGMAKARGVPNYSHENSYRIVRKDGQIRWIQEYSKNIHNHCGAPTAVQGILYDITSSREAEESLRRSDERYRLLAENVKDVIWALDDNMRYTYISPSVEKTRGYTVEEAMGLAMEKIFTKSSYEKFQKVLSEVRALKGRENDPCPEKACTFELEMVRKDGSTIWTEVTGSIAFDSQGRPAGYVGMTRDITERKRAEQELKISREQLRNLHKHSQDVRERERTRIAREIHDELGQVLTALKMDIAYLAKKLPDSLCSLKKKTDLMLRSVDTTIQSVKRITMDLRPGLLDHLGLVAAMEWQAGEFQERTGIKCSLSVSPEDIPLRSDQSTTVFRIFQEALTNIARHARATEVKTILTAGGGVLKMTVRDNGIGITDEQIKSSKSYGLMGIKERAYFCGGKAKIIGRRGEGTTVVISIPFDETRVNNDTSACG